MEDSDEDSIEMVPIEQSVPDDRDQSHCKKSKVTYKRKQRSKMQKLEISLKHFSLYPKSLAILRR